MSNNESFRAHPALLEAARAHLVSCLQGKENQNESIHPWRRDWEFAVLHSLRVEEAVLKILAREGRVLAAADLLLLRLAAILHDIARLDERDGHALRGAVLAREWLEQHPALGLSSAEIERVVDLIACHSDKSSPETDACKALLKDADTLDEIGAMSIFMAGNRVDAHSPFFFYELRERLVDYELPFCDQKLAALYTDGARAILREKKVFIEGFIAHLDLELQTSSFSGMGLEKYCQTKVV